MVHTRVRPWKETFRGKGTGGPSLYLSHRPSSLEQVASPDTNTGRIKHAQPFYVSLFTASFTFYNVMSVIANGGRTECLV